MVWFSECWSVLLTGLYLLVSLNPFPPVQKDILHLPSTLHRVVRKVSINTLENNWGSDNGRIGLRQKCEVGEINFEVGLLICNMDFIGLKWGKNPNQSLSLTSKNKPVNISVLLRAPLSCSESFLSLCLALLVIFSFFTSDPQEPCSIPFLSKA